MSDLKAEYLKMTNINKTVLINDNSENEIAHLTRNDVNKGQLRKGKSGNGNKNWNWLFWKF